MLKQNQSTAAPTGLLFEIVHPSAQSTGYRMADVIPILNTLYPGINYWWSSQNRICKKFARADIAQQHPLLATFESAAQAVEVLGAKLYVVPVRPCAGYEWQGWVSPYEVKSPSAAPA